MSDDPQAVRYEIRVVGALSEALIGAFPCLEAEVLRHETRLVGSFQDQAALFGALNQIETLGLELLELRRTDS